MAKYLLIIAITILGGWYFISQYKQSKIEQEGLVVCNEDTCEKSIHIHANISASVCGQPVDFDTHHGDTNEQHTHKDDDLMHFHNRLRVDPHTHEIIDPSPLYLENFLQNKNLKFGNCNGKPGKLTVIVNGQENSLKTKYLWEDGDVIQIIYE